jgi:hypothetical protein
MYFAEGQGKILARGVEMLARSGADSVLPPAEELLNFAAFERHIGRAAMVALAAIGGGFHLTQQRIHFLKRQAAAGAHTAMASHRAAPCQWSEQHRSNNPNQERWQMTNEHTLPPINTLS